MTNEEVEAKILEASCKPCYLSEIESRFGKCEGSLCLMINRNGLKWDPKTGNQGLMVICPKHYQFVAQRAQSNALRNDHIPSELLPISEILADFPEFFRLLGLARILLS